VKIERSTGARIAECGTGIVRQVRLGREPGKGWRGLHGRKPGICSTVVPLADGGQ